MPSTVRAPCQPPARPPPHLEDLNVYGRRAVAAHRAPSGHYRQLVPRRASPRAAASPHTQWRAVAVRQLHRGLHAIVRRASGGAAWRWRRRGEKITCRGAGRATAWPAPLGCSCPTTAWRSSSAAPAAPLCRGDYSY
eukprot:scaffold328379_cov59-Tisochrysis_lutea.AAC.1